MTFQKFRELIMNELFHAVIFTYNNIECAFAGWWILQIGDKITELNNKKDLFDKPLFNNKTIAEVFNDIVVDEEDFEMLYEDTRQKKTIGKVKYIGKDIFCSLTNNKIYEVEKITNVDGRIYLSIFDDDDQFDFSYMYDLVNPHDMTEPDLCGRWELVDSHSSELTEVFNKVK